MIVEARTERLILRPLAEADAEQIQVLFPQWEIVRFLRNRVPWPYPPDGAHEYLRHVAIPQMERGEAWHWSIRRAAEPDSIVGSISLIKGDADNRGFWLAPEWRGLGLMAEACIWVNDFWFDVLGFGVLRVSKACANQASHRISEKHGMRLVGSDGEKDYVSGRLPSQLWELTAEEWCAWKKRMFPRAKQ